MQLMLDMAFDKVQEGSKSNVPEALKSHVDGHKGSPHCITGYYFPCHKCQVI